MPHGITLRLFTGSFVAGLGCDRLHDAQGSVATNLATWECRRECWQGKCSEIHNYGRENDRYFHNLVPLLCGLFTS